MEINIQYYWVHSCEQNGNIINVKQTGVNFFGNWYILKGFVGDHDISELYEVVDAILNFEVDKEEEFVIHYTQFNAIPKEIAEDFLIEVNLPTA